MFKQLIAVITTPVLAFRDVREKPTVLFPLLVVLGSAILAQLCVIHLADFDFLLDQMVAQNAAITNRPESEIRQGMQMMTPTFLTIQIVLGISLALPLVFAIYGGYLNLVAKLGDDSLRFKHFYSLMCWASIPAVFSAIATILNVLISSDRQFVSAEAANPLNLNNLFFSGTGSAALNSIDLISLWSFVLVILGFKVVTNCSWLKAVLTVLLPPVLIGGLVALIF